MAMPKRSLGCLGLIAGFALGTYALLQTELGKWIGGLLFVYGGAIFAGPLAYDLQSAVVVDVKPRDHELFNGQIKVSYVSSDGVERTVSRTAVGVPGQLDGIEVGDSISVFVCKKNPLSIKFPSLQAPGGPPCAYAGSGDAASPLAPAPSRSSGDRMTEKEADAAGWGSEQAD